MKKCLLLLLCACTAIWASGQGKSITDQIIVKIKDYDIQNRRTEAHLIPTITHSMKELGERFDAIDTKNLYLGKNRNTAYFTVRFPCGSDIDRIIAEYNKLEEVEYAEPDHIDSGAGGNGFTPNDKLYNRQWGLHNDGTFSQSQPKAGIDINIGEAWTVTTGDSNIIVAILDSGGRLDHPEFAGRIWLNHKEISGNSKDDDNNGYVDDYRGWDFVNKDNDPTDDHGHGTNVGGIAGSTGNNNLGYAGVDWNCKLMFLKVLSSDNTGYQSNFTAAIYYAVDHGAKVINMSIGGSAPSNIYRDAVNYALKNNVTIVACMMNNNVDTPYYPAAFPGVIAVGSIDPDGKRTQPFFWDSNSGSNYGSHISVVGPGNYIYGLSYSSNTNYGTYWGGTSQATPHVTGVVALMLAHNPGLTPAEIKTILEETARDGIGRPEEDTPGWDKYHGWGLIDAYKALTYNISHRKRITSAPDFVIYPNPAYNKIHIATQRPLSGCNVQIVDIFGRVIQSFNEFDGDLIDIDCDNMPDGIYMVQLRENGITAGCQKLVIVH